MLPVGIRRAPGDRGIAAHLATLDYLAHLAHLDNLGKMSKMRKAIKAIRKGFYFRTSRQMRRQLRLL
jgi:hypothetical protein